MPNWHSRQHGTEDTSLATTSGNSSEAEERYLGTSACTIRGLHLTASFLGEKSAVRPRRRTWSAQAAAVGRAGAARLKGSGTTGAPAAPGGISLGLCLHQEPQRVTRGNSLTRVPSGQDGQPVHAAITEGAAVGPGHNAADRALGAGELWPGRC